jgi:hypothetical protein
MVIRAHRAGPVAQVREELHQGAVADFLERLEPDPAACGICRPGQVTVPGAGGAHQVAQVHALAFQL